jgi:glutathione reductase (NADPH)
MAEQFDLFVIGTGTAAQVAAMQCRAAGLRVAVADHRPFGGTCALRGCNPKKILVGGASAFDHARRMHGRGIDGEVWIDWPALMAFKRSVTDPVPKKQEQTYAEHGIATYHGVVRFTGTNSLRVGETAVEARHILIATGAKPAPMGIPGKEHLITNEDFLSLESLPRQMVMVGGGYIAAEFSHIAARAGVQVVVLQRAPRMLTGFEPELVSWLMERFQAIGVDVRTGTIVNRIEKVGSGFRVHASSEGQPMTIETETVVHAAGRIPALDQLDLQAGQVAVKDGRLLLKMTSYRACQTRLCMLQVMPPQKDRR